MAPSVNPITTSKKTGGTVTKSSGSKPAKTHVKGKTTVKTSPVNARTKKSASQSPKRYKCRLCGYVYSPHRGKPQSGIPAGTEFEDLPDDNFCPLCGFQGKGKIGNGDLRSGIQLSISVPSVDMSTMKRGANRTGVSKPGQNTKICPDNYFCSVCALAPKINEQFGNVLNCSIGPLYIP